MERIPVCAPVVAPRQEEFVLAALRANQLAGGPHIAQFEERFARWSGRRHGVACCNGSAALELALTALDPPPGWAIQFMRTVPVDYQLVHVIPYAWGPALAIGLLAGLGYGLVHCRRRASWTLWVVCAAVVVLVLTMLGLWMKMTRYLVPLTPLLCVLAGMMFASALSSPRVWTRRAWVAVGAAVWVASLFWCAGYVAMYGREDSRVRAARWLAAHVRPGDIVALEKDDAWGAAGEAMLEDLTSVTIERLNPLAVSHDRLGLGMDPEHIRRKRDYLAAALADADWLVITHNNRDRLRRFRTEFPVINEFYDDLFAGRAGFEQAFDHSATWHFLGLRVDDSRAEPSFRLFDHPRVYVFRRTGTAPPGRGP